MWSIFGGLEAQRRKLLSRTKPGALHYFYEQPFPEIKSLLIDSPFIAVDFETTGLDIKDDHILSFGLVDIENLGIKLASARHQIINTPRNMSQEDTVIHQITDDAVSLGKNIRESLDELLYCLTGKVLIAHNARLELGFLNRLCQQFYQQKFIIPCIDTLQLANRQLQREQVTIKPDMLRLFSLRDRYHLPRYKAHHALSDALTTAELFLILSSALYPDMKGKLGDLLLSK